MVLRVDPEELESQANRIEDLASQFGSELDRAQGDVEALDWDGQSREAFVSMFTEARSQFKDVEEQIGNIAATLRAAKEGLIDADATIARSVAG